MIDALFQYLDAASMYAFGLRFSLGNGIVLGVFFLFGFFFGKLTRNITILKILMLVFFGVFFYEHLKSAHFVIIWVFLLGIVANHGERLLRAFSWAHDLKDVLFALKHRRAFEDIKRKEEELAEREKRSKEEQARFYRQKEQSQQQQKWREEARREQENSHSHERKKFSYENKARSSQRASSTNPKERYLRILGLDPKRSYSKNELKKAFRKRAQEIHPDKGGSHDAFIALSEAYEWLSIR